MNHSRLVELIPAEKREKIADMLIDIILLSKNDNKMPSSLANTILYYWKNNRLASNSGLLSLLEAAMLLEPEQMIKTLKEHQLNHVADQLERSL